MRIGIFPLISIFLFSQNIPALEKRFIDIGKGIIEDTETGLMWTQDTDLALNISSSQAQQFADDFTLADYDDWRAPSKNEAHNLLQGLYDYGATQLFMEIHTQNSTNCTSNHLNNDVFLQKGGDTGFKYILCTNSNRGEPIVESASLLGLPSGPRIWLVREKGNTDTQPVSDATPDNFAFTSQTNVEINSAVTSNIITISGINTAASVTINNGEYRINGGVWSSASGSINNGDAIQLRHTSSNSANQSFTTSLTVGGVNGQFTSTTLSSPDQYGYLEGFVHDACSGNPLPFIDLHFSNGRVQQTDKNGNYSIKLANGAYDVTVRLNGYVSDSQSKSIDSRTYYMTFPLVPDSGCGALGESAASYKAIIVTGGGAIIGGRPNYIWPATQELGDKAYKALKLQGFGDHHIHYLSADPSERDADGDGINDIDAEATLENLQSAITEWALDVEDVVVFLIGHGGQQSLHINRDFVLSATQLNSWLDDLQSQISGKLSAIIDACYSGSFIPVLAAQDRYILSSTSSDSLAIIANKGGTTSFSYYFWDEVVFSGRLGFAFSSARQSMSRQLVGGGKTQKAVLDTNGDRSETKEDYTLIKKYCYGLCNSKASVAPEIESVAPQDELNGQLKATLSLTISNSSNAIADAWATIQRPDYHFPSDDSAVNSLPQIKLNCQGKQCEGVYDNFNLNGEYQVTFYVEDTENNTSLPRSVKLHQTGRDDREWDASSVFESTTGLLTLKDIEVGGQHYYVELKDQGDYVFSVHYVQPLAGSTHTKLSKFDGQKVIIPSVLALGNFYSLNLLLQDGFLFQLDFGSIAIADE